MLKNSVNGLILFVGLLFFGTSSFSQSELAGRVTAVTGTVVAIGESGDRRILQKRDTIHVGDQIETNASSLVQLRFIDSAILLLGCNSSIGIGAYSFQREDAKQAEITLHAGNLRSIVGRIAAEYYRLKMADTVVQISGGDFAVALAADESQYFGIYDGAMTVTLSRSTSNLGAGANADFAKLQPGVQFEELTQQPQILNQSVLNITDCTNQIN